jgi:hypothetical protein
LSDYIHEDQAEGVIRKEYFPTCFLSSGPSPTADMALRSRQFQVTEKRKSAEIQKFHSEKQIDYCPKKEHKKPSKL